MSSGAMDLLERMLVFDPSKRITGNLAALHEPCCIVNCLRRYLDEERFCQDLVQILTKSYLNHPHPDRKV
jgi:serine/threonine protein kinase